jgi:hypothetical protein
VKQFLHKGIDSLRQTGFDQLRADEATRPLEPYTSGQFNLRRELLRVGRRIGERAMDADCPVETRDRQVEHDLVEVPAPHWPRAWYCAARPRLLAIEDRRQVAGFIIAVYGSAIAEIFDYEISLP